MSDYVRHPEIDLSAETQEQNGNILLKSFAGLTAITAFVTAGYFGLREVSDMTRLQPDTSQISEQIVHGHPGH